jgi:multidrug efflux pump subunit AcrA (membrane-fusion protein)
MNLKSQISNLKSQINKNYGRSNYNAPFSDTMTEGKVSKWHKKVGDAVKEGDILAEIETDKAVQDFESEMNGTFYISV